MSKSKPRNSDVIFELKRQLKEKDEIIRKLQIRLTNEAKEEKREQKTVPAEPVKKSGDCPECSAGKLTTVDLGVRDMTTCSLCKYRKTVKK